MDNTTATQQPATRRGGKYLTFALGREEYGIEILGPHSSESTRLTVLSRLILARRLMRGGGEERVALPSSSAARDDQPIARLEDGTMWNW